MKLNETQVALVLKHAPKQFEGPVEFAQNQTAREWSDADDDRAESIQQILENGVYDFEQLGWEIMHDVHRDEYSMAVVTPVPNWHEGDLDDNTRRFIYEWKEATMDAVDEVRASTGLRPRLFVAAMLSQDDEFEVGTDQFEAVATTLGYTEKGLRELLEAADGKIEQATNLYELTYGAV